MNIPAKVLAITNNFLDAADTAVPGFIQGLYLVGSVALGDFQAQSSDVDFVVVSAAPPSEAELQGLAATHASLRKAYPDLNFDGPHLTWAALAAGPQACAPVPFNHEGNFEPSGNFALDPVTWHELVDHGVALRGPTLDKTMVWYDVAILRAWMLNNYQSYWLPWLKQYQDAPDQVEPLNWPVTWGVLGVVRLHYTLVNGRITSKTGAGQYALETFDGRWQQIITDALNIRTNPTAVSTYENLSARRSDVCAFMQLVIDAAQTSYF